MDMDTYTKSAYLEIIIGPMFSGKTSRLVDIYKQCKFCFIPVVVINHVADNRYHESLLSTHDNINIPCIKTDKLLSVWREKLDLENKNEVIPIMENSFKVVNSDVILINEGQFFPDLKEFVEILLKNNKQVYVCGLDGDFERNKFGQILDIIPLCDKINKLTSLCALCKNGTKGIFSARLTTEKEQMVVGADNYIPVCRTCYETYPFC